MPTRAVLLAALAALLAAGCSGNDESSGTDTTAAGTTAAATTSTTAGTSTTTTTRTAAPTLRLYVSDQNTGPWRSSVTLKLRKDLIPRTFFVCGVAAAGAPTTACVAPAGAELPAGTLLRLEQRPAGPAATSPDSPGWGTVGTSQDATLSVPLSNFVSGNQARVVSYRVTLRPIAGGAALASSNVARVTWQG